MARHNRGVEHRGEHKAGGDRVNRDRAARRDERREGRHHMESRPEGERYRPEQSRRIDPGDADRV